MPMPLPLPIPDGCSYLKVPGVDPLLNETVGDLVDKAAILYGNSRAFYAHFNGDSLSFNQVKLQSDLMASGLLELGLEAGDRIGIYGLNCKFWYLTYLAAAKAGLVSVGLNTASTGSELLEIIGQLHLTCVVIGGSFESQNFYQNLVDVVPQINGCINGILIDKSINLPSLKFIVSMEDEAPSKGIITCNQLISNGNENHALQKLAQISRNIKSQDTYTISFTSGSTGDPKRTVVSHHSYVNTSYFFGQRLHYNSEDKICLVGPFFHAFGSLGGILLTLHFGTMLVLPSAKYDSLIILKAIEETGSTIIFGRPTMHIEWTSLIEKHQIDVTSIRLAITSGAPCPPGLIQRMKNIYKVDMVGTVCGQTEAGIIVQSLPEDSDESLLENVGYPCPHSEVKIIDENGDIVPLGVAGELCVRSYGVMKGYLKCSSTGARSKMDSAGWLHTGDIMTMKKTGHMSIQGRMKEIIKRNGESIYPMEVEEILHKNPFVNEAYVFALPNPEQGQTIGCWIRLKDDTSLNVQDIKSFFREQMVTSVKIPEYVKFTKSFPKLGSGKVSKILMQKEMCKELGLDI